MGTGFIQAASISNPTPFYLHPLGKWPTKKDSVKIMHSFMLLLKYWDLN
jgi:hypothetical protein